MATGFQFAHLQWAAAVRAKSQVNGKAVHGTQRGRGWSMSDLLAEAQRLQGHCAHVVEPKQPVILFGSADQAVAAAAAWSSSQTVAVKLKDGRVAERKMRSDAPVVAAGVISFPRDRIGEWPVFRDHAVKRLVERYGDRLRLVVEHLDEAHPHLHFYCVPLPGESFGAVHVGYAASRAARKQPENKVRSAFIDAMRGWQDWVHTAICKPFGLARLGPARRRLSRKQWKEEERIRLDARERQLAERANALAKQEIGARVRLTEQLLELKGKQNEVEAYAEHLRGIHSRLSDAVRRDLDAQIPALADTLKKTTKLRIG